MRKMLKNKLLVLLSVGVLIGSAGCDSGKYRKLPVKEILTQLPPHQTGSFGQLQEWFYDFKETDVNHRHVMHLWAFYPDDDITIRKTPELAEAVKVVLNRRGDFRYMGMFSAWKINMYVRFEEPEKAYTLLQV
jgi:alpha-L-fucosidase 2